MRQIIKWTFLLVALALMGALIVLSQWNSKNKLLSLPRELKEISGMEFDRSGDLWAVNDGGNPAALYQIDSTGRIGRSIRISNAQNVDWEDMTQDEQGHFFVGDFGNNKKDRTEFSVYKLENPADIGDKATKAEVIRFRIDNPYPRNPGQSGGAFDVEAFVFYQGSLYLFSKNRSRPFDGFTNLYRLEGNATEQTARLVSRFRTCQSGRFRCWVTGAALSPDRTKLALLGSNRIWVFRDWTGDDFFSGSLEEIDLGMITQKEAIAFKNDSTVVVSDENFLGIGGNLYAFAVD